MQYFQVEVITDDIGKVIDRYEQEKDELEVNVLIQTYEGTNRHIFTFEYEKDEILERAFSSGIEYPKEKFILSVLQELSHEGIVKSMKILKENEV